jgi:hypothetical protein
LAADSFADRKLYEEGVSEGHYSRKTRKLSRRQAKHIPSLTLLVHLGTRGNAVKCHIHQLARLDNIEQLINVLKNLGLKKKSERRRTRAEFS